MKFVSYVRVSTIDQGKSGLGLKAQKRAINQFVEENGELIAEFQDIESGASDSRVGMEAAIEACKVHKATLVVKELSRITRGSFKYRQMLEDYKIDFIECGAPNDPEMVKDIRFALAKDERAKIRQRTRDALAEIKIKLDKGEQHISKAGNVVTSLGKPENLSDLSRANSLAVRQAKAAANENLIKATAFALALKPTHTLKQITDKLNEAGFKTARGGSFAPIQVSRLFKK